MSSKLKFKVLRVDDREKIVDTVGRFETYSDFNFTSLFTWGVNNSASFAYIGHTLVIRLRDYEDKSQYTYSLIGDDDIVNAAKVLAESLGVDKLQLVPEFVANELMAAGYAGTHDRDDDDYIYDIPELIAMEGPAYRKQRRALSNLRTKNSNIPVLVEVSHSDSDKKHHILELTKRWRDIRGRDYKNAANEYFAIRKAIEFSEVLAVKIWGLYMDDALVGFTITEQTGDVGVIHFEKADTGIPGIGTFLKHKTCERLFDSGCIKLNYEQDLGIPGLRQQKMSLNPSGFLKKYTVTL